MTAEPRVWCAMIYVADSRDVAGAVRRSKRLHWKQEDARREVERWVTEMGLGPVGWKIADDETLIGRIPNYFVVVSSLLLPKKRNEARAWMRAPDQAADLESRCRSIARTTWSYRLSDLL